MVEDGGRITAVLMPVVVLTKCDALAEAESIAEEARGAVPGVDVLTASALEGAGLDPLRALMAKGTGTVLGASGAGKTSLLNALERRSEPVRDVAGTARGAHHHHAAAVSAHRRRCAARPARDPGPRSDRGRRQRQRDLQRHRRTGRSFAGSPTARTRGTPAAMAEQRLKWKQLSKDAKMAKKR